MMEQSVPLADLSELQRTQAYTRFTIIRPALEDGISQAHLARIHNIPASTIQRWVSRYREKGIAGLADAERSDKGKSRRLQQDVIALEERLAFQGPRSSARIQLNTSLIVRHEPHARRLGLVPAFTYRTDKFQFDYRARQEAP